MEPFLPKLTFILGPRGSGKTTLAKELVRLDDHLCLISLDDPIRQAMLAMFDADAFLGGGPSKIFSDQYLPLASAPRPGEFLRALRIKLRDQFGKTLWGELGLRSLLENEMYYSRFIIDEGRIDEDFAPFLTHIWSENEAPLILHLAREGSAWSARDEDGLVLTPGRHVSVLNNGSPRDAIDKLRSELFLEKEKSHGSSTVVK